MDDPVGRQLAGAELWVAGPEAPGSAPVLVAGWEDGATFCAAVCATDVGLAFCRRCPEDVVRRTLATGRAASARCPAGVRLLAFPAPRGDRGQVGVLRAGPPDPGTAASISGEVRIAAATLRNAARATEPADGRATLGAARELRDPASLVAWQAAQRTRGAEGSRTAAAALAQMIATSDELLDLYRASQRQRKELDRQRRRLDRLARQGLRAKDDERARIAHEIHDTAAQSMISAFRFLEAARASAAGVSGIPEPVAEHLREAGDRLAVAIREVRNVLSSLLPPGLEELGLAHAIRARVGDLAGATGIEARVVGDLPRLQRDVEQALFGMAGEAVSNAVRHAGARTILVELGRRGGRAVVTVTDDGSGFDQASTTRPRTGDGLGLLGLSRQASWLGGRASVRSRPGHGTRVRISIPIERHVRRDDTDGGKTR